MRMPGRVRTSLERAARGRRLKRRLQVGDQTAQIYVSGDAQLKYLRPGKAAFDRDIIEIARTCLEPEDIVWDVGANIGVFSVAAATCARSVVAFEADIWLAGLIRSTAGMRENRDLDIQVVPAALSATSGIAKFSIASRGRASNALSAVGGRSQMGGIREEVLVPTLDLDGASAALSAPDFIKIDVEGAEMMVVSGGRALFRDKAPLVYIEVGESLYASLAAFFEDFGYEAFDDRARPIRPDQSPTANLFFAKSHHAPRLERFRRDAAPGSA